MYLNGLLTDEEEKILLDNDLTGVGWKVEEFKIVAQAMNEAQDNTYAARLAMISGLDPNLAEFQRNDVLAISTYGGGGHSELIDHETIIVDTLFVQNLTQTASDRDWETRQG